MSSLWRLLGAKLLLILAVVSGLAQRPELIVQAGHSDQVGSVAFNPDSKMLASGSYDNTVKLWDVTTGRQLRTLLGHQHFVASVVFSPNGKTLASASFDGTIKLWDVATGTLLRTLVGHVSWVNSVTFSPNGKMLASGGLDTTIRLWDVATGRELRALRGHNNAVYSVAFSPDGRLLASGSIDNTISLWDPATYVQLRSLPQSNQIYSVAFSPDGKMLAGGSYDKTISLWDVATGKQLGTLVGHAWAIISVAFSPDGKTLASGSVDGTIKLWDVATATPLRSLSPDKDGIVFHGLVGEVTSVVFSPDGKTLASGSDDIVIRLWDVATGTPRRTLGGHVSLVTSVAFSPDGKTLANTGMGDPIRLWDVATGTLMRSFGRHNDLIQLLIFNPDGKTLATDSADHSIKLWDVETGVHLRSFTGSNGHIFSMAFSPNGKILASGSYENPVVLWDVATGAQLRSLAADSKAVSVAFSPDNKTLASGGNKAIELWDVATGTLLRTLPGSGENVVFPVAFSPDGKILANGSNDGTVKLWDVATGALLRTLRGHDSLVWSVAFSPDGKQVAGGSRDTTIVLWNVTTGRPLRWLAGHSNTVVSVIYSSDGKLLASGSEDATVKLWDTMSGRELVSLISLDEMDWLVVTPEGLFDGTPTAWNQLIWRAPRNTIDFVPIEAFFTDFFYPGLLAEIFATKRPRAPLDIAGRDRRQPQLRLTAPDTQAAKPIAGRRVNLKIDLSDIPADKDHKTNSGARDVRLFRNGSLVKVWHGDVLKGQSSITLEATIPIVAGENKLTAYAFNHDNIKSNDETLTVTGDQSLKRKGVAYVLAVGINKYVNAQYNLKYAVADAKDFGDEIKREQTKLKNYERVEVISLSDIEATKANILKSLTDLSGRIQPEDALVIFFAGHGTAQHNRFYLVPYDLGYTGSRTRLDSVGLQGILSHSISDEEIERTVEGIDAGQMLLVIDACNSGQALEAEEKRRGPMNSKGLAQLAYEKGMYILTAAQSYQAANEAERYGHGFLTYALVEEGLKTGAADRQTKDGQVLLREWLDFATERVPQMQQQELDEQKKQGRQLDRIKFAEADAGNERSLQRPRVFYRREAEPHPLVVARP